MAGKKIDGGTIVLKTTDGGSFKVTAAEAKKLTKQVDKLGGASQRTDRRIKGVTGQSSNASKNFSKQAQTMQGGIVAVYATIAAQIFAVSAAFQFLKSSFETRNLIEGQKEFGAVTGVAYQTITRNVQDATGNMLQFKEAASGVAIGIASGLGAGALEKLGAAAKNASLALGRDVTDSFNRLIKGVTKAEPELLDELGIVLRLENATNKYATAIGKTREQLNAYERTQAVLNDVLDQAETKYKVIGEVMDPDAFALGQLTKEIDELMMSFQTFVANGLTPIISFFKDNAMALVAAMGLFVLPIIKSLLPDLNAAMLNSADKAETASSRMKESWLEAKDAHTASKFATEDVDKARSSSAAGLKGLGVKSFKGGEDQLNARQIAAYKRHMRDKTGIYKKFNMTERANFRKHLIQQEAALRISTGKQVGIVSKGEYQKQALSKMTTAVVLQGEALKQRAMAATAKWGMRLMSMMGWVGIIAMVVQGLISLVNWFRDLDEEEKALREETAKTTESLELLNEEINRMGKVRTAHMNLMTLKMSVEQLGNALQSANLEGQIQAYHRELDKGHDKNDEVIEAFAEMAKGLAVMNPQFGELATMMENGERIGSKMAEGLMRIQGGMINAGMAAKQFAQNQESLNKALDSTIRKFSKVPYQELEKALSASIEGLESQLGVRGGTGVGQDEFAKDATFYETNELPPMLQQIFGTTEQRMKVSKEFGFFAEAEQRKLERAQKSKDLSEALAPGLFTSGSSRVNRYKVDAYKYDDDGLKIGVKTLEELKADIMSESGWDQERVDKSFTNNSGRRAETLERLRKAYEDQSDQRNELIAQAEADIIAERDKINLYREQLKLEQRINKLQKDGFDLNSDLAASAKEIAESKANILNADFKSSQIRVKEAGIEASILKVRQKIYDKSAAETAVQAAEERIRTAELNKLEDGSELKSKMLEYSESEWKNHIANNNLQSQELETASEAVRLADEAIDQQKALTSIEIRKLQVQRNALDNAEALAEHVRDTAFWAREYKNALTIASRIMKEQGGAPSAIAANRQTQLDQLRGTGDDIGSIQRANLTSLGFADMASKVQETEAYDATAAVYNTDGSLKTAAVPAGVRNTGVLSGGTAGEKVKIGQDTYTKYLQPVTEAQKLYNTYLDQAIANKQIEFTLTEKQLHLLNEINGTYLEGQLSKKLEIAEVDRNTIMNLNPASVHYWEVINKHKAAGGDMSKLNLDIIRKESIEIASLAAETELLTGIQSTLTNGFQSMFQSMIDGTKSFKDSMKDLAKSVLADLAAMFMKAAAVKMMLAMFPGMGDGGGGFKSLFGGSGEGSGDRYGGIRSGPGDRYGGIRSAPGYGGGGVAQGPNSGYMAKLHGTEAIVPLGNDRSIPVDIRGGGGNTVNVSINMQGGQSQTSASGGGDMQALGRSIGGLVQQHLQTEMRPGGLLNRQGAKGRGG
ncbi:MAG TPA: hypothetical protein DCW83_11550 [Saprospirales bacterium]|jgi:hypothetical protein|nr:hypothetical protein [Saprospirales bacterium]